jgi:hypothetical protein
MEMVTRSSETPDEDAVRAALAAVKPAGITLTYAVADGITWTESSHSWTGAGGVTWDEASTTIP